MNRKTGLSLGARFCFSLFYLSRLRWSGCSRPGGHHVRSIFSLRVAEFQERNPLANECNGNSITIGCAKITHKYSDIGIWLKIYKKMAQSSSARLPYFEATWKNVVAPLINIIRLTLKCVPVAYTEILNKLRRPIQGQQKCVGLDSAGGSKKSFVVGLVSRDPALTEKEPERWHTWRAPAPAYNRGLGVEPPVGSGGKAPWSWKHFEKQTTNFCRIKCDENPTMSTLLFFLVHLYSFIDPESLNCHMQYFVHGVISAPFSFLLT